MSNSVRKPLPLSRRGFLGLGAAAGAAAGVAAIGATGALAAAPVSTGSPGQARGAARPRTAISPLTPLPGNAVLTTVGLSDWAVYSGASLNFVPPDGVYALGGAPYIEAPVNIPAGSTIILVDVYTVFGTTASSVDYEIFTDNIVFGTVNPIAFATASGSSTYLQTVLFLGSRFVGPFEHVLLQAIGTSVNGAAAGAVVAYIPPAPNFHAITPSRAYDSRLTGGPILSGAQRTISVATTTGGAPLVPSGASSVTYNLTVADTVGTGFLGLFPTGTAWAGNSSVNWFTTNELDANGGVVALGGDRQINVICGGGGSTDFIVDVTGYFL